MYPEVDRPDRYHISGQQEIDNLEMAQMIAEIVGKPLKYEAVDYHSIRHGHDTRYSLDSSKIHALGWEPPIAFHESLVKVIEWSSEHPEWMN
jgi:dTDP-glucose 4,6-dehydratase